MRYIRCRFCGAVNYRRDKECRRCGFDITLDKNASLQKATAFLIAAVIFYIPANIYPILKSSTFSKVSGSTIIEGIFELMAHGDYPVAIIILIASVLVPVAKFIILAYLILSIKYGNCDSVEKKVRLYHLIEITGPWSLIDVFVVIILTALIQFKSITIIPGFGVSAFALMVFLTILSSYSLDERLLGDECGKQ